MKSAPQSWVTLSGLLTLVLFASAVNVARTEGEAAAEEITVELLDGHSAIAPPPLSPETFPCSDCHEPEYTDRERRELPTHEDIVLRHDEENRWCLDCHDADNRDMLHLADGRLVAFTESYKLCGQCHGPQLKSWRAGDHGRRTGSWSGDKLYLLCAHCHNPHSPAIEPFEAMPPPIRQEEIR